jgi:hypothetical protein
MKKALLFVTLIVSAALVYTQETIINETFDNNDNNWYESEYVKVTGGRYEIFSDRYAPYVWMDEIIEDGSFEADAVWLDGTEADPYGLIFRLQDADNFYVFWINGVGRCTLAKIVNGSGSPVRNWANSEAINKKGSNHIRIEFCGSLVNIFINGVKEFTAEDNTFSEGKYGFYSYKGVKAAFDNAVVVSGSPFELQMPGNGTMDKFRGMVGNTFLLTLTGSKGGKVWGTDIYTDDSNLAAAAVHSGALKMGESGTILITMLPGQDSYSGSERNGITTSSYGSFGSSYKIERFK